MKTTLVTRFSIAVLLGHTEGLEPMVTEALLKLMISARGGKIQTANYSL